MIYIEEEKDYFVKYKVTIQKEELLKLKLKIIRECGEIVPCCYEAERCRHDASDFYHVSDYREEKKGKYDDAYDGSVALYQYSYKWYEDTSLSKLIDQLLSGDMSAIYAIKNPVVGEKKVASLEDPNIKLNREFAKNPLKAVENRQEYQEEFEIYKEYLKLNLNRKDETEYYALVLNCISMEEIERMSADKYYRRKELLREANILFLEMQSFFGSVDPDIFVPKRVKKEL